VRPTTIAPEGPFVDDPTEEDFARAAAWALSRSDHRLAFEQAAAAVVASRGKSEHVALLDRVIAATPRPLETLKPGSGDVFFGIVAAYARALARAGRVDAAIDHLFLAAAFEPEQPLAAWGAPWTSAPKAARKVRVETMSRALVRLGDAASQRPPCAELDENLAAAADVAERVRLRHDEHAPLLAAEARLMRVLGQLERAEALLDGAERPAWELEIERAALASAREDDGARLAHLERALALQPREPSTLLDLADALIARGELERAIAVAAEAAATAPDDGARARAETLSEYASQLASGTCRATEDLWRRAPDLAGDLDAYSTRLPDPVDPLIGVIRGVAARAADGKSQEIRVRARADNPLCPSAARAFELTLRRAGKTGALEVVCPRSGAFAHVEEVSEERAVAADTLAAIASLASSTFHLEDWARQAEAIAATVRRGEAAGFIGAAAEVPVEPPAGTDPCSWVHAFQIAAALVAAARATTDDDAARLLEPLARATDDWLSIAALLALGRRCGAARASALALELAPREGAPLHAASRAVCQLGPSGDRGLLLLRRRVRRERASS
jgi:tetratricopeptide (TPR) repeat protein